MDDDTDSDNYIRTNTSTLSKVSAVDWELYRTARVSPLSLTYYGLCLGNGNYTIRLHFVEIIFKNDSTFNSLGKRIFDIYIQVTRQVYKHSFVFFLHKFFVLISYCLNIGKVGEEGF